jgi:hypothetical protein
MKLLSAKAIDFIEKKQHACKKEILNWLDKGEIAGEISQELLQSNEQLSQVLRTTFVNGESLVKKQIIGSYSELLNLRKKPRTDEEAFEIMRRMVIEGSENPVIRKLASDIAENSSQEHGMPVPIPHINRLYSELPADVDDENIAAFVEHCKMVARDIYVHVRNRTVYVPDPPDDYFQPAIYTLEILNLRGDCDDLAILLCSLYRSIGYRTFIGFQPQHVYAGVTLPQSSTSNRKPSDSAPTKKLTQFLGVPTDPYLRDFQVSVNSRTISLNIFDIVTPDTLDKLIKNELTDDSDDLKTTGSEFGSVLSSLASFSRANVFHIDPDVLPIRTVEDAFREYVRLKKQEPEA